MTRNLNIHHNLKWFVSHIADDLTALKVSRALSDCTPAHALMELVRNDGVSLEACSTAYKSKYTVGGHWSLAGAEQAEFEFERMNDI
jgi:hypothetical protein